MPSATPFSGYPQPTSNTTYTPNQFFDVVLPHASRGAVRLVAYMLRKVLGWSDSEGRPQQPTVLVSYRQLEEEAGIGHSMIRAAIDEAIEKRYIRCVRAGARNAKGALGASALYELRWDERDAYVTDPDAFDGFFAGNGNLTYIPNAFFDYTVRHETLSVVKVVGAIIRHTIGFQTRYGFRRQQVAMSFSEIQRRVNIPSPTTLNDAVRQAVANNHIVRVEEGYFDPEAGKRSRATVYAVRWAGDGMNVEPYSMVGDGGKEEGGGGAGQLSEVVLRETVFTEVVVGDRPFPGEKEPGDICRTNELTSNEHSEKRSGALRRDTPKNVAGDTPKNVAVTNPPPSEKRSGNAPESVADRPSEKRSDQEITPANNTREITEQQPLTAAGLTAAAVVARSIESDSDEARRAHHALLAAGFDRAAASLLLRKSAPEKILQQLAWLDRRKASQNRLGLLRRSIEEDWPEPQSPPARAENPDEESLFCSAFYAAWSGSDSGVGVSSSSDRAAAGKLLAALRAGVGESERRGGAEWGTAFGSFVRRETTGEGSRRIPRSLVLAARELGDRFLEELSTERRRARMQDRESDRRAHEAAHRAAWLSYIAARMEEVAAELPQSFAAFEAEDARRRRGAAKFTARLVPDALGKFDSPEERRLRFVEFFQVDRSAEVLGFWEWDARLNPERFDR